jgi:hypothetical protein
LPPLAGTNLVWDTSKVAVNGTITVDALVIITNQPQSLLVYVGSNATFSVTAGGNPAPAYRWRLNGTNISSAGASVLTVTNCQPASEGAYTVVLTNVVSSITSAPAILSLYREFGRAPAPYPSLLSSNGARHLIVPGFQLGVTNSASTDARTNAFSEDGVTFTAALIQGQGTSLQVIASKSGYLNAWVDYATNGSWATPLDQVFTNVGLLAGTNTLNFTVPASAAVTPGTWARFRFSSATNLSFVGEAPDGEVEDYLVAIQANAPPVTPILVAYGVATNGSFALRGTGAAGQSYILLAASNPVPPAGWIPIATNAADSLGLFNFTDTQATNYSQRFYRIATP